MTQTHCDYSGNRDEALVAYLYGEIEPAMRAMFDMHLTTCAVCRDELTALGDVRARLGRWVPPEHEPVAVGRLSPATDTAWWREIPAWAQVAAALLFLGVAVGLANVDIRYDRSGLSVKTGWLKRADPVGAVAPARSGEASAPWRSDLAVLEERLRSELRAASPAATTVGSAETPANRSPASLDAEALERVRALIGESERRQQRELALRVAEIVRDVNAQRQADLVKIDRSLGLIQNNTGVEVMKQRQLLNYLVRTSQRQQ